MKLDANDFIYSVLQFNLVPICDPNYLILNNFVDLSDDLITYAYDKLGNRVQMITQSSGTINYAYDSLNRLTSLTDAQGKITAYSYDSTHNLTQINYPNNTKINYSFDKLNRLLSLANTRDTNTISSYAYEYNLSGMRTKVTLADGTYINYAYDGLSRLTSESKSDPSGEGIYNAAYQYDNVGNRLNYSKTDYHGFNDDFNRVNSLDAGGLWNETTGDWQIDNNRLFMPNAETDAVIIYSGQDIANPVIETTVRLETVGNKKGSYIVFGYQSRNDFYYAGLEGISDLWVMGHYQNGVYNDLMTFSQPIEKLIDYHLKVTVKDNVVTLENLENGVWVKKLSNNFGSLPMGKVGLSVEKSRTQFDDFKVTWQSTSNTAYSYNQGNQLTQSTTDSQSTSYAYDRNGNLTQKTEGINPTEYAYDYANRLLSVIASGSESIYSYDGLGKRISKSVNGRLTKYVYDSANIIFAQTPQESITYTHSLAIDSPISMRGEVTVESYYHSDGLGSITNLTNPVGQSVQSYQYDAFGNALLNQGNISNPYAYTARELDSETGLYYYRNRYYDPKIGRFITQDPIGILDDINLYAYVGNSPVNFVDPWGLCKNVSNWKWSSENWLWQYLYGGGEWTDTKFLLMQAEEFQKNRLPLSEWFSLAEIPWGPPSAYGTDQAGIWLEKFFASQATKNVFSIKISRNSIYISGYRPGWFKISGITNFISRSLSIATVAASGADIGTMAYSYYRAYRRYYGY